MAEPKAPSKNDKKTDKDASKSFNAGQFMTEVRQESNKVTWPDRKEVGITTGMVIVMAVIAALYLLIVDFSVQHFVRGILSIFA